MARSATSGSLVVGETTIPYAIRRSPTARRKRIEVGPDGVIVIVPKGTRSAELESYVDSKRRWLYDAFDELRERTWEGASHRLVSGARVPFRGRKFRLRVYRRGREPEVRFRNRFDVDVPRRFGAARVPEITAETLQNWLLTRVTSDVHSIVRSIESRLGTAPAAVRVGEMTRRWGSCGPQGTLAVNWRLVFAPKPVLEYVVVHELCHLVKRDHSEAFWSLLRGVLPDFEPRKAWLDQHGHTLEHPFFEKSGAR